MTLESLDVLSLNLAIKPISYNQYYRNTRTGKRIKTGMGLAFDEEIAYRLADNSKELKSFGESLDPSNSIVRLRIRVVNPDFFLKDGSRISKTAGDVDNWVKVLKDKIFREIGIDDFVVRWDDIADCPGVEYSINIVLERLPIPQSFDHRGEPIYRPKLGDNKS